IGAGSELVARPATLTGPKRRWAPWRKNLGQPLLVARHVCCPATCQSSPQSPDFSAAVEAGVAQPCPIGHCRYRSSHFQGRLSKTFLFFWPAQRAALRGRDGGVL